MSYYHFDLLHTEFEDFKVPCDDLIHCNQNIYFLKKNSDVDAKTMEHYTWHDENDIAYERFVSTITIGFHCLHEWLP